MSGVDSAGLTIGELARATGVRTGTLRMWETRYGFPTATRTTSGQRRYAPETPKLIAQVLTDRDAGLLLPAAIERARTGTGLEPSLYGFVRRIRPDLPVHHLAKSSLVALSRAIEDESASRGRQDVLIGAFQHERHYRASERRWKELAHTVTTAIAFADFPGAGDMKKRPREIPITRDQPLCREWVIAVTGPHLAACLLGWEPPRQHAGTDSERMFEAMWSADRDLVHQLITAAAALADHTGTQAPLLPDLPRPAPDSTDLQNTTAITNRMIAYLTTATARLPQPSRPANNRRSTR